MNVSKLITVLVAPLCVCTGAMAQGAGGANPADAPVSRAEVLADLQIWRESGLAAEQQTGDRDPELFSDHYRAAEARYADMHASPSFAALVDRIARKRGEKVDIASQ